MSTRIPDIASSKESGTTLMEVLIALFVLALGLLGIAMLQATGMRFTTDSYSRSQATFLAYDIIERMRANRAGVSAGSYDVASTSAADTAISNYNSCKASTCDCVTSACTSANLARYDLGKWYEQQERLLIGAAAAATVNSKRATIVRAGNSVTVTLYWMERDSDKDTEKSQSWQAEF